MPIRTFRGFLIVSDTGSLKAVKNKPAVAPNEIAIALHLNIPSELFQKPALSATIDVPDNAVPPTNILMENLTKMEDAINRETGLKIKITIDEVQA